MEKVEHEVATACADLPRVTSPVATDEARAAALVEPLVAPPLEALVEGSAEERVASRADAEPSRAGPTRLDERSRPERGEIAFVSPEAQVQRTAELLGEGLVVVEIPPLPAAMRGRLAEHIDEHVERVLGTRGCPSPYLAAWSAMPDDAETRLSDQLFRARTVGGCGLALALGSMAAGHDALTPEDSATVARLARATTSAPLLLLLDDGDATLGGYGPPVPLTSLLAEKAPQREPAPHEVVLPAVTKIETAVEIQRPIGGLDAKAVLETTTLLEATADALVEAHVDTHVDAVVAPIVRPAAAAHASHATPAPHAQEAEPASPTPAAAPSLPEPADIGAAPDTSRDAAPARERTPSRGHDRHATKAHAKAQKSARSATVGVPVSGPTDFWRSWALALGAAKGPQPLAAFERLFVESYVPLANAIIDGLDDPRALRAYDEFRRSFERAYTDAFQTFGATNRRPRLVMDAHDVASKQARLHNARSAHLLVVDSMRYDLGGMVRDALAERAPGAASLTSESILFAALPTTTIRQLETIARGIDALRAPASDEPSESLRGRSADTVRRLRVGSRELYKLDAVPAHIGAIEDAVSHGEGVTAGLEDIADHVADSIARHLATLAPRTLVLVMGDHGFCVDRRGEVTCGGAAPEEVMVPALAYLVGDLH